MKQRTISALIMIALFLPVFIIGGLALTILFALWGVIASYEIYKALRDENDNKIFYVIILLFQLLLFLAIAFESMKYGMLILFLLVITLGLFYLSCDKYNTKSLGNWFIAIIFPALGFGSLALISTSGLKAIIFIFIITVFTDMFAYFVGVPLGKHKLAPSISPKKSIEGSAGGMIAAMVFASLYVIIFGVVDVLNITITIWLAPILASLASVIGQIGDLFASKIKREAAIKDYSNLFPGHGGIMDRFDSVIWVSMFFALLSMVVSL